MLKGCEQIQAHDWIPAEKVRGEPLYGNSSLFAIPKKSVLPCYIGGIGDGDRSFDVDNRSRYTFAIMGATRLHIKMTVGLRKR